MGQTSGYISWGRSKDQNRLTVNGASQTSSPLVVPGLRSHARFYTKLDLKADKAGMSTLILRSCRPTKQVLNGDRAKVRFPESGEVSATI